MQPSRRVVAVTVAALSLGGAAITQAASASTSPWSATATKAVSFNQKALPLGAAAQGSAVHVALSLAPRNSAALATAFRAMYTPGSATFHHFLTAAQWTAAYGPKRSAVTAVTRYLSSKGFTGVSVTGDHLVVNATGTVGEAERAFNTSIARYRVGHRTVIGNTSAAMVPSALAGTVAAVMGLNTLPLTVDHPVAAKAGSPDLEGGLYPAQFATTYDATSTPSGSKTSIAILTEGNTTGVISSLRLAESKEHLATVPVTVVKVGPQSADTSGADEFDMDSQVSTGDATSVKQLYMYNIAQLTDSDVSTDFATFASQDKAAAMSASIGGCEYNAYLDGSMLTTDNVTQEAAMQGQSLFASSGDNGDACMYVAAIGAPAGVPGDNWPAVGTFTTAVGGTSLVSDSNGNRIKELAWAGSGGGTSTVENAGFWTEDTDAAYTATLAASGGREVPDIALDADPNVATPALIYVGSSISYVGGTSLSSPLMLGFWSRLESAHGNSLGLASVDLYQIYDKVNPGTAESVENIPVVVPALHPKPVAGFTDIKVGSNGIYPALPGYDETTGLGAPDVAALNKVIAASGTTG
jgi:pseudomonalisin